MNIDESYIILFEHAGHQGATLRIPLAAGAIARINAGNLLYEQVSSFYVQGPPNVWVCLHGGYPDEADYEQKYGSWQATNGAVDQGSLDGVSLRDHVHAVSWHIGAAPPAGPWNKTPPSEADTFPGYPAEWTTDTQDNPTVIIPSEPIPEDEAWCVTLTRIGYGDRVFPTRRTVRATSQLEAAAKGAELMKKGGFQGFSVSKGSCNRNQ